MPLCKPGSGVDILAVVAVRERERGCEEEGGSDSGHRLYERML